MMNEEMPESANLLIEQASVVHSQSNDLYHQSLGQIFMNARQQLGLSVAEVARQLFLTQDKIHSIESDQLQNFVAPIYARGYVESYAKLLGISQKVWEPFLSQLGFQGAPKSHAHRSKPVQVDQSIATFGRSVLPTRQRKKNKKTLWVSLFALIVIFLSVVFWSLSTADHHLPLATSKTVQLMSVPLKQGA
jgi:cytoskeletal protein RodZ